MAKKPAAGLYVEIGAKVDKLLSGVYTATNSLKKFENNINKTMKTINGVINAALVVGGVVAIKKLEAAFVSLADKGEELGSIEESFKKLGGTSNQLEAARKATIGLVDSFALMKSANAGLVAGIPGFNENFSKIADLGARLANTLGTDTTAAINQVTDAIKSGKSAALAQVGIIVDAEKVYGKFGNELTNVQKKALLQAAAIKQLPAALERFAEVSDSAANAHKAVGTAMDEVIGKAAISINSNQNLQNAWRELEKTIQNLNFKELASEAADFFATMLRGANAVFPFLIQGVTDFTRGMNYLFGNELQSKADRLSTKIGDLQGELYLLKNTWSASAIFDQVIGGSRASKITEEIEKAKQEFKEITAEIEKQNKKAAELPLLNPSTENYKKFLTEAENAQKESIAKTTKEKEDKELKAAQKIADKQADELKDAYKESVDFWTSTFDQAINGTSGSLKDSLKELLVGFAASLAASVSQGFGEGIKGPGGLGELLGSLVTGGSSGQGSFIDVISNAFGFGMSTDAAHAAGIQGPGLQDGSFPSGTGPSGASIAAGAAAAISTITSAFSAAKIDKANKDNSGTGATIGGGAGAIGGSFFGPAGTMIGQQIGSMVGGFIGKMFKWGPQNPETIARHAFANFIEDSFKKLSTIAFFDAKNKLQTLNSKTLNFIEGDTGRFNKPDWVKDMDSWGDKAKQTFLGLGEALKEVQGITEDVGSQIGFLLGENLSGNIDNARLLVYQLGLSFEDMEKALVNAGLSGEMTWHEVEVALQGVSEAFKPGIEAVGDLAGAVDELMGSGGRGAAAIKSIKDIAVEAMQAGAKSLADLPRVMAEDGVAQETIDAIMKAIEQRGIKTLEQLAAVSDRVGGGIIADIESNSQVMAQTWEDMAKNIQGVTEELSKIPAKIESNVLIKVNTSFGEGARETIDAINGGGDSISIGSQAFANGGIISSRSRFGRGIAGEAGAEAILPLKTMPNGRLGVSGVGGNGGGTTLVINAQGASPGVEHMIRAEIEAMGNEAVSKSIQAMQDMAGRGGRYADF